MGALDTVSRRFVLSVAVALLACVCVSAQNTRNILILHVGSANQPAHLRISRVFRDVLGAAPHNQFFEEFVDYDRLKADDQTLVETLGKKYAGKKMDLVLSDGGPVLNFLLRRGEELWPGTPKVFSFVEPREMPAKLPPNFTGVTTVVDFGATLDLALQLMPNRRRVFYVAGDSPREESFRHMAEQEFGRFAGKIEITYLYDLPLSQLLARLSQLPDDSVVIFFSMIQDAAGQGYIGAKVASMIASSSNAPVYCLFDTAFGSGAVGGVMLDVELDAEQAARLGLRVLNRGSAIGLPIESSTNRAVIDWRQLQRWGVSEKSLPAGTAVLFRPPSLWDQYKWFIVAGSAAIVVQLLLIIVLLIEMRRRKKSDLAVENLTGRLINAGEEERKRIARELHDDIVQRLSVVSVELKLIERKFPTSAAIAHTSMHEPLQQLSEIMTDLHNLSHQLHSRHLEMLGLEVALEDLCQQLSKQHDVPVRLIADEILSPLPQELELCFFRIAQEALNNSVKHSGSPRVEVRLTICDGMLSITIKDFGTGFDSSVPANGLGLATMHERLRLVDGTLLINTSPGGGTEVTAQARLGAHLRPATPDEQHALAGVGSAVHPR
jgi:signal transduction histidine kinase